MCLIFFLTLDVVRRNLKEHEGYRLMNGRWCLAKVALSCVSSHGADFWPQRILFIGGELARNDSPTGPDSSCPRCGTYLAAQSAVGVRAERNSWDCPRDRLDSSAHGPHLSRQTGWAFPQRSRDV